MRRSFCLVLAAVVLLVAMGMAWLWRATQPESRSVAVSVPSTTLPIVTNALSATAPVTVPLGYADAVDAALRETDVALRAQRFGEALMQWFAADPDAVIAYLQTHRDLPQYTQGLFLVLQALAKTNPNRALLLARDMATTHEQKFIYSAIFDQIARTDMANSLVYLQLVPPGAARENALRALAGKWTALDSEKALTWAKSLVEPSERTAALETILSALVRQDPLRTITLAKENLDGDAMDRVVTRGLRQLADVDPKTAANFVSQLPPGALQKATSISVARSLAGEDINAALNWLQSLPAGDTQQTALNNVLDIWVRSDAAAAGQYIATMAAGEMQNAAARHLAENWGEKDHASAIAWAASLADESARSAALLNAASGWARVDAPAATQWAVTLAADNGARTSALRSALSYWVLADPGAAAAYVGTLSEADQMKTLSAVAPQFAQSNVNGALAWAQSLSPESVRRLALSEVVNRWKLNQPAEASQWLSANQ